MIYRHHYPSIHSHVLLLLHTHMLFLASYLVLMGAPLCRRSDPLHLAVCAVSPIFHYQRPPSESFRETPQSLNSLQAAPFLHRMSQRTKLPGNTDCYRKLLQLSVERGLSSEWIPSQSSRGNQRYCQMARYVVLCYLLLKQLICGRVCCCFSLPGAPIVWLPCLCFVVSCVFSGWTAADISFHQHMEYLSQSWLVLLMMHPTWAVWGSPNHTDWTHWLGASLLAHPSIHVLHVIISWFFLFEYISDISVAVQQLYWVFIFLASAVGLIGLKSGACFACWVSVFMM